MEMKEIREAQERVAMKDPEHLLRWLQASNREFLIFVTRDLMTALKPDNLDVVPMLQQAIFAYTQYRMSIEYDVQREREPLTGEMIDVPIVKDDRLTLAEKDRLIRQLAGDLSDAVPGWTLDSPPIG